MAPGRETRCIAWQQARPEASEVGLQLLDVVIDAESIGRQAAAEAPLNTLFVIAADRSGSMSGRPWDQVQGALLAITEESALLPNVTCRVITYNDKATLVKPILMGTMDAAIRREKAGGLTCFSAAFDCLQSVIECERTPYDRLVVVFMTDGQNSTRLDPSKAQARFKRFLHKAEAPSEVHAIGFSKGHNFKFLETVRECGTLPGAFRYAEPGDGPAVLRNKFQEIFEAFAVAQAAVTVRVKPAGFALVDKADRERQVVLGEDGAACFQMWVRPDPDVFDFVDAVQVQAGEARRTLPLEHRKTVRPADEQRYNVAANARLLRTVERDVSRCGAGVSIPEAVHELAQDLQRRLRRVSLFGKKGFGKEERIRLLDQVCDIQARLDAVHGFLAQHARDTITGAASDNSLLARAADIRFAGQFTKSRRQRLLDQRVSGNAAKQASVQQQLLSLEPEQAAFTPEAKDFFHCTLSQVDILELLEEEPDDILGFGLACKRPETVVDASTTIRIQSISSTLVTRNMMQDATRYRIAVDGHLQVHGGFDVDNLGVAVVGRSREPINSFLPLYVCQDHWNRVSLLLPATLGYFCCLDALAFAEEQYNALFMVLGTMLTGCTKPGVSERELRLLFAFQRTVRQVALDRGLMPALVDKVKAFVASPAGRTKDQVGNLMTFFGYLAVLDAETRAGLDMPKLWLSLIGESVRRAAGILLHARSDATLLGICARLLYGDEVETERAPAAEVAMVLQETKAASARDRGGVPGDEAFVGWSFDASHGITTASLPKGSLPGHGRLRKTDNHMAAYGRAICDQLPGPNIARKKEKAEAFAARWWDSLRKTDVADISTNLVAFDPQLVTTTIVSTVASVEGQVDKATFPRLTSIAAVAAFMDAWGDITSDADNGDAWRVLDANDGVAPDAWTARLRSATTGDTLTLAGALTRLVAPQDTLLTLRAILLQGIVFQSNKVARTAAVAGKFAPLTRDRKSAIKALKQQHERMLEKRQTALESIEEHARWTQANQYMLQTDDLWAFAGYLAKTHSHRGQGFCDLLETFKDQSVELPLRAEKLEVMLTGRLGDHVVFCRGNKWLPEAAHRAALSSAVGADAYIAMEAKIRSFVGQHVYRESDIPNRHGYCNSNPHDPWHCALCCAVRTAGGRWPSN